MGWIGLDIVEGGKGETVRGSRGGRQAGHEGQTDRLRKGITEREYGRNLQKAS